MRPSSGQKILARLVSLTHATLDSSERSFPSGILVVAATGLILMLCAVPVCQSGSRRVPART